MFKLRQDAGFTLVEMMVVVVILGILLAVGVPMMKNWTLTAKANSASGFYLDGFQLARQQAISHNAASRIVLTQSDTTKQWDWQVDICYPTPTVPCSDTKGGWSTATVGTVAAKAATNEQQAGTAFTSVFRSAAALPNVSVLQPTLIPAQGTTASTSIYFNSQGWVDTTIAARLKGITLLPGAAYAQIASSAVMVNLAGTASKCNPDAAIAAADSRYCPP